MREGLTRLPEQVPELVTPRVRLRALDERDVDALFAMFSDAETMRWWSSGPWPDRTRAQAMLAQSRESLARGEAIRWGVERRDTGALAGTCTLFAFSAQNRRAEVGYLLAREHWGAGLMREAIRAVTDWAFDTAGLIRIEADIDPENAASLRLAESLGFRREGLLRSRWIVEGRVLDSVLLGLLADDRPARG